MMLPSPTKNIVEVALLNEAIVPFLYPTICQSPQVTNILKLSLAEATIGGTSCSSTKSSYLASYSLYALFLMEYRVEIIYNSIVM
jgi:hypothetical protein